MIGYVRINKFFLRKNKGTWIRNSEMFIDIFAMTDRS